MRNHTQQAALSSSPMNLKLRLNLIITLLLALVLLLAAVMMIHNARDDVRAEVQSTATLAMHLLDAEILHYTSDFAWLNEADGQNPNSIFRLHNLGNVRHLRIEFFDANGRLRDSNIESHKQEPTSWLVSAMGFISPALPEIRRKIFVSGRMIGELVVTPDPSYEIQEVLGDVMGLLLLVAIFFVAVNALVYWAVGRAMRPVDSVMTALNELERGNLKARLPDFELPELAGISRKFNAMAETLETSIQNNHKLTQQLIRLQEDERKNLARDLHDEIGQYLTAVHVDASAILNAKSIENAKESAKAISAVARQMMDIVHDMLQRLRPSGLDAFGLSTALKDLVSTWKQRNQQVDVHVDIPGRLDDIRDETTAIAVYRIVQECLTNVTRHSNASRVDIRITIEKTMLNITVEDNGRGFNTAQLPSGFGLAGMRERVEGLGGRFSLDSALAAGTRVNVELPLQASAGEKQ
ncbi:signal transduction histidine kinase, glucose-6-phosphate specific [Methylobacillus flagellatus KT]|uniref:Oxygen sensor histidine kinase NreB n=2 Tax=Methylobacillus flagellatus TaxID=405 RepID=Q1H355_METFK|nr:signal transduction histidine kinase, glucose-6-phosphate specific [Methylobacillus flagellatus KT]